MQAQLSLVQAEAEQAAAQGRAEADQRVALLRVECQEAVAQTRAEGEVAVALVRQESEQFLVRAQWEEEMRDSAATARVARGGAVVGVWLQVQHGTHRRLWAAVLVWGARSAQAAMQDEAARTAPPGVRHGVSGEQQGAIETSPQGPVAAETRPGPEQMGVERAGARCREGEQATEDPSEAWARCMPYTPPHYTHTEDPSEAWARCCSP